MRTAMPKGRQRLYNQLHTAALKILLRGGRRELTRFRLALHIVVDEVLDDVSGMESDLGDVEMWEITDPAKPYTELRKFWLAHRDCGCAGEGR